MGAIESVLVVDDDQKLLNSARRALGRSRRVTVASSAVEALAQIGRDAFDLAIVDVYLRDRPGFEITRRLQRESSQPIIVMMSGLFCAQNTRDAYRAGAWDCIDKPFDWLDLVKKVENQEPLGSWEAVPTIDDVKRDYYRAVLAHHGGSIRAAAGALGIKRWSLQRILRRADPPTDDAR